jgi:hypothetical protein
MNTILFKLHILTKLNTPVILQRGSNAPAAQNRFSTKKENRL